MDNPILTELRELKFQLNEVTAMKSDRGFEKADEPKR